MIVVFTATIPGVPTSVEWLSGASDDVNGNTFDLKISYYCCIHNVCTMFVQG